MFLRIFLRLDEGRHTSVTRYECLGEMNVTRDQDVPQNPKLKRKPPIKSWRSCHEKCRKS